MYIPFIIYMAISITILALAMSHKFRKFFVFIVLFAVVVYGLFAVRNAIAEPDSILDDIPLTNPTYGELSPFRNID